MMKYFIMESSKNVEEYVSIKTGTKDFSKACQMSEFQFFDDKPITLEVDEDSGIIFQDFIYDQGVPVISDRLKDSLDSLGVDYLLYKKMTLTKAKTGVEEVYWLGLPPRINCLNREESEIDEILNVADEIVINDDKTGRYEMFKLAGVGNLEIVLSERIAMAIKESNFIGIHIYKVD